MNALISPSESVYSYDGSFLGWRVAQVATAPFDVAPPLFWTDCADDVAADQFYYEGGLISPIPVPPQPSPAEVVEQTGPTIVAE
jgi:hypothetical protein